MNTEGIIIGKDCEDIIKDYVKQLQVSDKYNKVLTELLFRFEWEHWEDLSMNIEFSVRKDLFVGDITMSFYISGVGLVLHHSHKSLDYSLVIFDS